MTRPGEEPRTARAAATSQPPAAARAIIELARQRAGTILEQARSEARVEREQARQAGYIQGLEEGRATGQQEARAELGRVVAQIRAQVQADIQAWADEVAPSLVHLALEIAEAVIRDVSDGDRRKAIRMATDALTALGADGQRRVRCHPDDVAAVAGELALGFDSFEVMEDRDVDSPGCIVMGENGRVDATIDTQMARVRSRVVPG